MKNIRCCLPKSIKEDGLIPITSEIQEIFDRENNRFKSFMGRDISKDDPLMSSTLRMSESEYKLHISGILEDIGVNPRVIYAFNKLGYTLVEGEEFYSDEQIEEWNLAIEEYEEIEEHGEDIETQNIKSATESIMKAIDKLQFLYALIIRKYANKSENIDLIENVNPNDYILFCLTRNLKTLKAITILAVNDFPEDALNLTRTNFENYAEIVYSNYDSKNLKKQLIAENGVKTGTHKRKWRKIINKENNEQIHLKSNHEKISLHPVFKDIDVKIYKLLYSYLSSYTHPDIMVAFQYIDKDSGFTDLKDNSNIDPLIFTLIFNFMIIHEIYESSFFETSKEDLVQQNKEIYETLNLVDMYIGKLNENIRIRINKTIKTYS
ncbi:DUF5677 domain-containing protein [Jiulongibacter sediminis]